jgi:hypothetical protein
MENNQSSLRVNGNDLILHGYEVDQGPYRLTMYRRVAEEDYTATTEATGILGADCVAYLNRYFLGFRFLKTVKEVPSRGRNRGFYKMVRFVLRFDSDADAETARRHVTTAGYCFDFQYRPAVPGPNE